MILDSEKLGTHFTLTHLDFNQYGQFFRVIYEEGTDTRAFKLTAESAVDLGVLNLDALLKVIEKDSE